MFTMSLYGSLHALRADKEQAGRLVDCLNYLWKSLLISCFTIRSAVLTALSDQRGTARLALVACEYETKIKSLFHMNPENHSYVGINPLGQPKWGNSIIS